MMLTPLPSSGVWRRRLDRPDICTRERWPVVFIVHVDQHPQGVILCFAFRKVHEAVLRKSKVHLIVVEKVDFIGVTQEYDLVG